MDSAEKRGQFVGIAEHFWHAMTLKILTGYPQDFLMFVSLLPLSANLCTDAVCTGSMHTDPNVGIVIPWSLICFRHPTADGENSDFLMPFVNPNDLNSNTLLISQEDGQQNHAKIVEIIKNDGEQLNDDPVLLKFKYSLNNDQFEEVIAYNDLMAYIEMDKEN